MGDVVHLVQAAHSGQGWNLAQLHPSVVSSSVVSSSVGIAWLLENLLGVGVWRLEETWT